MYLSFGSQLHIGFLWSEWPSVSRKELKRSMSVLKDHNGHSEDERCDFPSEFSKAGIWQYLCLILDHHCGRGSWCVTRPEGWWLSKKCNFAHQSLLLAVAINRSWNCTQKMNLSYNIILGNGNKGKGMGESPGVRIKASVSPWCRCFYCWRPVWLDGACVTVRSRSLAAQVDLWIIMESW